MKTSDFYFDLPPELIAQTPLERRDGSRLLTLDRATGETKHLHFYDLPALLRPGDCLVLNDSRVLPARLIGKRAGGGACEVLLLIDRGDRVWECLVRPGRKLRPGAKITFGDGELSAEVVGEVEGGNRLVRFDYEGIFLEALERLGKMPLPPYIKAELQDQERYQTVYSKVLGSAAASHAVGSTQDQRNLCLAAEHIAGLGHLVEHFVHANADEVGKVHIHDRTRTGQGSTYAAADDERLRDRSIHYTAGELMTQALELAENTTLTRQVFAHDEYFRVFLHFFFHGFQGSLGKTNFTHVQHLLSLHRRPCRTRRDPGTHRTWRILSP